MGTVLRRAASLARIAALAWPLLVAMAGAAEELAVGAATSLRESAAAIASHFELAHPELRVRTGFAASSWLAAQLRAGAPLDIVLSADDRIVDDLVAEGLVSPRARLDFACNRLVVVATPELAGSLRQASDLAAPAIRRIAMPASLVPAGRYARIWLPGLGLLDHLAPKLVPTEHARATLAAVDLGHADAAIVYASDARLARAALLAFEVPDAQQPRIVYAAARSAGAGAAADAYLDHLRGEAAQRILAEHGFAPCGNGSP